MKHLLLCAEDSETQLRQELARSFPKASFTTVNPLLFESEFELQADAPAPFLPHARQFLPNATPVHAESIRAWADAVSGAIVSQIPEDQPWALHIEPHYGARAVHRMGARAWHTLGRAVREPRQRTPEPHIGADAGKNRCGLIRAAVIDFLRKKRRRLLKMLHAAPTPFTMQDSLIQVCLTSPATGYLSVARTPEPFQWRQVTSFLPLGEVDLAIDKAAPSRAFAKLVEAEIRLGRQIGRGESCVDLGAAPGSWTYVAAGRGARVFAVDRSPLREDLMAHPKVEFISQDAFQFAPPHTMDWLLCDVIAEPARTAELLLRWLQKKWCRAFVVTLKLKDSPESLEALDLVRSQTAPLVRDFRIHRLCANKKEVCVFGSV